LTFLLILALLFQKPAPPRSPHQEGPFRRQIGENGRALIVFDKPFSAPPCMKDCLRTDRVFCMVSRSQVQKFSSTKGSIDVVGPIGIAFDVTCYERTQ
jgi:hypothetical protein